jgi:hypothetical protein
MGGGLMQLVAYGAQDVYLTGNPQITFFKVVYRRHTNFSMEAVQQTWNGQNIANGRCTATISRNGDLIHKMYIELQGTTGAGAKPENPGSAWITDVELEIGGQKIDKHSGLWMETWSQLSQPNENPDSFTYPTSNVGATSNNIGVQAALGSGAAVRSQFAQNGRAPVNAPSGTLYQITTGMGGVVAAANAAAATTLTYFVPLMFWFCRNPGLALPLIALQYQEVKIILNHTRGTVFPGGGGTNNLWVDYIYLDTDERRRFAQVSHEYLIEQVQEQTLQNAAINELNFNHPVKEIIISNPLGGAAGVTNTGLRALTAGGNNDMNVTLKLNGHDRFARRTLDYFTRTQVNQHHTGCGGLGTATGGGNLNDGIFVYSFALKPEEHQPSGTCNFSRIDTAQLVTSPGRVNGNAENFNGNCVCFAVNYNVLRIMSGMGGLAYSN